MLVFILIGLKLWEKILCYGHFPYFLIAVKIEIKENLWVMVYYGPKKRIKSIKILIKQIQNNDSIFYLIFH
jgi:hypothetical protein